jgi:hypothetical protein
MTNFQGTWWGEGDDMIRVDSYKWPQTCMVPEARIVFTRPRVRRTMRTCATVHRSMRVGASHRTFPRVSDGMASAATRPAMYSMSITRYVFNKRSR